MSDTSPPVNIEAAPHGSFIDAIVEIASARSDAPQTLGHVVDALDDRAFGLLILILAIPCLVPGLPGAQLIAIPIFLLGLQIVFGRNEPWLPGWAMRAKLKPEWLTAIADFASKRLRWTVRLSRPRWRFIAHGARDKILGLIIALAAVTIMLPITNTIPSLAITVAAVGLLQRALDMEHAEQQRLKRRKSIGLTLARTVLQTIMEGGSYVQFESKLLHLHLAGLDIGSLNHSREFCRGVVESMSNVINMRIRDYIHEIDPVTNRMRLFSFMADKVTKLHRTRMP